MVAGLARVRSLLDALKSGDFSYSRIQWGQNALASLQHSIDQRGPERGTAFVGYLHKKTKSQLYAFNCSRADLASKYFSSASSALWCSPSAR